MTMQWRLAPGLPLTGAQRSRDHERRHGSRFGGLLGIPAGVLAVGLGPLPLRTGACWQTVNPAGISGASLLQRSPKTQM